MYNTTDTQQLQQSTLNFLKDVKGITQNEIEALKQVLRFHEYRYYVQSDPLIADGEYDSLFKQLEKIEQQHPDLVTKDSPSQRVAKGLIKDFPKVQHLVPMLSLDNSYNAEDLLDFDRKARELSGLSELMYCVEPKFDGASISLIYENDMLLRGATRGDGVVGDDITANIRQIRSIPMHANFSKFGIQQIEIRGEVLMTKDKFEAYNNSLEKEGLPRLANPRNAAAGSLRIKDSKEVGRRNLDAFLYHVSDVVYLSGDPSEGRELLQSHSGALELLWRVGFRSPQKEKKVVKGIQDVIDYCLSFESGRDNLPYEIDGMVIKVDDADTQDRLGMTTHHPRWAIAFKFKARQATSILRSVEFQVGRTGAVTPVGKIDAVNVGGVMVSSLSLHNEEYIKDKNLLLGDTVLIERSGDVIPQLVKSFPELRKGEETPVQFPVNCPVCGFVLQKQQDEAVWRCNNSSLCSAQLVEKIIHFTSKDAMDIRGLGESIVQKLYGLNYLKNIPGIYQLPYEEIGKLEGFGTRSIAKLKEAIQQSKQQPLHRLIYALGIRFVGETTAKTLTASINNLMDLSQFSEEQLMNLEDIGPKVAGSIHQYFKNPLNITLLNELKALGLQFENVKKTSSQSGNLAGQTFLFTGTLEKFKRSDAEQMVEDAGGKLLGSVSSKLNYLVVGKEAGSKLEKAKKITSIHILTEDAFLTLFDS